MTPDLFLNISYNTNVFGNSYHYEKNYSVIAGIALYTINLFVQHWNFIWNRYIYTTIHIKEKILINNKLLVPFDSNQRRRTG